MNNKTNKTIVSYSAKTLLVLMIFSLISVFLYSVIMPKSVAEISYNMGWKTMSEHYYVREYQNQKSADSLYNVVLISATNNSNNNFIKYYDLFLQHSDYGDIIADVDKNTEQLIISKPYNIKSLATLLNEDNYFKNKYVNSLIETGKVKKAVEFAVEHTTYQDIVLQNQNNFLLGKVITPELLLNDVVVDVLLDYTNSTDNEQPSDKTVIEMISSTFYNYYKCVVDFMTENQSNQIKVIEYAYLLKTIDISKQIAHSLNVFNNADVSGGVSYDVYTNAEIRVMLEKLTSYIRPREVL